MKLLIMPIVWNQTKNVKRLKCLKNYMGKYSVCVWSASCNPQSSSSSRWRTNKKRSKRTNESISPMLYMFVCPFWLLRIFLSLSPCYHCCTNKKRKKSIFVHGALITLSFMCVNYFVWFVMVFNIKYQTHTAHISVNGGEKWCDATAQQHNLQNQYIYVQLV